MNIVAVLALILLLLVARFRIPLKYSTEIVESEVQYHIFDLDPCFRDVLEGLLGRRKIQLAQGTRLYVTRNDYRILRPESPLIMSEKGYTFKVCLCYRRLFFGGEGPAKLVGIQRLGHAPSIKKSLLPKK